MELRGRILFHGPRAVVLERRRNPPSGRLRLPNVTQPGLNKALGLIERNANTLSMRDSDAFVAAHERCE